MGRSRINLPVANIKKTKLDKTTQQLNPRYILHRVQQQTRNNPQNNYKLKQQITPYSLNIDRIAASECAAREGYA